MVRRVRFPGGGVWWLSGFLCLVVAVGLAPRALEAQRRPSESELQYGHRILGQIKRELERYYYDSTFHGVDLDSRFRVADSSLNGAATLPHMYGVIAQFVLDLNDSHTRFYPPSLVAKVSYGWTWQMIGDSCYVVSVKPRSDAAAKGLQVGDRVLAIDGLQPTRRNAWLIRYVYYQLRPRPGMRVVVEHVDGARAQLDIVAQITQGTPVRDYSSVDGLRRLIEESEEYVRAARHRWHAFGDSVMVWQLPEFTGGDEEAVDRMMDRLRQRRFRALVLDLRDNAGGAVTTLLRLLGHFFDRDLTVGTTRERTRTEPLIARRVGREPYRNYLIVLVNSASASASEIVAYITQLEGRAIVVGDRTAGAVMASMGYGGSVGFERVLDYGLSIAVWDLIMPDGRRLESRGVTPNEVVLPTPADLGTGRDPALSRALAIAGVALEPDQAGRLFPRERRR